MPTIIALLSLLTPTLLLASPTPVTTPSNRLMIRNNLLTCAIVNVSTYVNCREDPNSSSASKGKYKDGSKHNFGCYAIGQCVDGNCTWDYDVDGDCFVNGFYTDNTCSTKNLEECLFS